MANMDEAEFTLGVGDRTLNATRPPNRESEGHMVAVAAMDSVSVVISDAKLEFFFAARLDAARRFLSPRFCAAHVKHELVLRSALMNAHRDAWRTLLAMPSWTAADVVAVFTRARNPSALHSCGHPDYSARTEGHHEAPAVWDLRS